MVLVNVVITCLVAWMVFGFAVEWTAKKEKKTTQGSNDLGSGNTPVGARNDRKKSSHYQPIIQKDIFRTKIKVEKKASFRKAEENKVKAPLRLTLKGTILGENQEPLAIILDRETQKQELYAVNESVQGAQISKITAHQVFLKSGGREDILTMSFENGGILSVSPPPKGVSPKRKASARKPYNVKGKRDVKRNAKRPPIRPVPRLPRAPRTKNRNRAAQATS